MVDGIIVLRQQLVRSRHERVLEVIKFRGSSVLYGAHTFRIGDDGIEIFPQLEALPGRRSRRGRGGNVSTAEYRGWTICWGAEGIRRGA